VAEKRTVIYEGPHALTSALASMLRAEGLDVFIHDKDEFRHAAPDMATIVELTVSGVAAPTPPGRDSGRYRCVQTELP
jgi:hypothetical protein